MEDLEQRIERLRQLVSGDAPQGEGRAPSAVSDRDVSDLFGGHRPAHAAPGPLLDDLTIPSTGVRIEVA